MHLFFFKCNIIYCLHFVKFFFLCTTTPIKNLRLGYFPSKQTIFIYLYHSYFDSVKDCWRQQNYVSQWLFLCYSHFQFRKFLCDHYFSEQNRSFRSTWLFKFGSSIFNINRRYNWTNIKRSKWCYYHIRSVLCWNGHDRYWLICFAFVYLIRNRTVLNIYY